MVAFEQLLEQICFFILMLGHDPSGTGRTGRPRNPRDLLVQPQLLQQHVEPRLDVGPRTLVEVLLLAPVDVRVLVLLDHGDDAAVVQRRDLLDADDGQLLRDAPGLALGVDVHPDLARAEHEPLDGGGRLDEVVVEQRHEPGVAHDVGGLADGQRVAQQLLGEEVEERLAEGAVLLPALHVEHVGGRGGLADLDVALLDVGLVRVGLDVDRALVRVHQLQRALDAARGVFGALAVLAVRQVHDERGDGVPLGLAGHDAVVDHDLRAVGEVAELRFPDDEAVRVVDGLALLEAEHGLLAQQRVHDGERIDGGGGVDAVEEVQLLVGGLVPGDSVALREGAALHVLAREAHTRALGHQRAERQCLAGRPVEGFLLEPVLVACVLGGLDDLVRVEVVREGLQVLDDVVQRLLVEAGLLWRGRYLLVDATPERRDEVELVPLG